MTEYGWGGGKDDDYFEKEYTDKFISLIGNGGYRWRFQSGMVLNLGAFPGAAFTFGHKSDYVDYGNSVIPFAMIDFFGAGNFRNRALRSPVIF